MNDRPSANPFRIPSASPDRPDTPQEAEARAAWQQLADDASAAAERRRERHQVWHRMGPPEVQP